MHGRHDSRLDFKIASIILEIRGQRVILDRDLANIYGVSTKRFNEQVKRNATRFPGDFMFRLTVAEAGTLRSQMATSKSPRGERRGGARYLPLAFTEHGAIQAANILNSARAIEMGIHVVRAFVRLRDLLESNKALSEKLDELERKYEGHDGTIANILAAIRRLMSPPRTTGRGIGFTATFED